MLVCASARAHVCVYVHTRSHFHSVIMHNENTPFEQRERKVRLTGSSFCLPKRSAQLAAVEKQGWGRIKKKKKWGRENKEGY